MTLIRFESGFIETDKISNAEIGTTDNGERKIKLYCGDSALASVILRGNEAQAMIDYLNTLATHVFQLPPFDYDANEADGK